MCEEDKQRLKEYQENKKLSQSKKINVTNFYVFIFVKYKNEKTSLDF